MKYVQVAEIYPYSCEGCAHDGDEEDSPTSGCLTQTNGKRADQACGDGIWIEDTPVARRSHDLLLVTARLTQEA